MKYRRTISFFGLVCLLGSGMVHATTSTVVCGAEIPQTGHFSWTNFSQNRGKPFLERGDTNGLIGELKELLFENSLAWPSDIRSPIVTQINGLSDGSVTISDFKITKDVSGIRAKQFVFQHTPQAIELPPSVSNSGCQPESRKQVLIDLAQYVTLVERSSVEIMQENFIQTANATRMLEGVYDKYLYEGFPMYPWEAYANSLLLTDKSIANGPPKNQLVLMHPAVGVVGAIGSDSDNDIGAVLSIEPIGWVRYTEDYNNWYGASLLAVFPSDRDPGYGISLNYNQFKFGVTWHDYDNDEYDDPTIFLGIDLYNFVDKKHRKYTSYKDKVNHILKNRLE